MSFNTSNFTDPFLWENSSLTLTEKIILLSVSTVLIVIGFLGNFLICIAFYAVRQIRSIPFYFIVSLSVADILLLVSWSIWVATGIMFIVNPESSLPIPTYVALTSNDIMCGSASMFNMAAVSLDRYLAVTHPLTYKIRVTHKRALCAIAVTWALAIIFFVMSWMRIEFDVTYSDAVIIFFTIFCDVLPLSCMIYCYVNIIIAARIQIRKMKYVKSHTTTSASIAKEIRLAMNLLILVGPQLLFWGTFFAITVYENFCADNCWILNPIADFIIGNMIYLVSVLNPYTFIMVTRDLRKIIKSMVLCKGRNHYYSRDFTQEESIRLNNSNTNGARLSGQSESKLMK